MAEIKYEQRYTVQNNQPGAGSTKALLLSYAKSLKDDGANVTFEFAKDEMSVSIVTNIVLEDKT